MAVILALACLGAALADGPSYQPFEQKSANARFVAAVTAHPWTLAVYERVTQGDAVDRVKKWSVPFDHRGEPRLVLSDDGQVAAYVAREYPGEAAVAVEFYRPGAPFAQIKGAAFANATPNGQPWLDDARPPAFEAGRLVLHTRDGRTHRVDPETGAVASAKTPAKKPKKPTKPTKPR